MVTGNSNNGHAPVKHVWAFNKNAVGCYVGLPVHDAEFMKKFEADFPKASRLGKDLRNLMPNMKAGEEHRAFTVGSRPVFDADGNFTCAVHDGHRFVFCQDRGVANTLGVRATFQRCEACLTNDPTAVGMKTKCLHPDDKKFLGFFGLREVFEDVTRNGIEEEEIDALRATEAQKLLKQKAEELGTAAGKIRAAEDENAKMAKELAALKKALEEKDAENFKLKAAADSKASKGK